MRRRWWHGPDESFAWLSIARVRPPTSARGVLPWAPLVGLVLGLLAVAGGWVAARYAGPLVGAVVTLALLAGLTRGLHLDGLADTADGLGPLRGGRERALQVMRAGDVGPFGVVTLVLTLLLQAACLAELLAVDGGWLALPVAVVAARLVMARSGMPGVAIAEGSALGRSVAGTVSRRWLSAAVVVAAAATLGAALLVRDSLAQGGQLLVAATIGMLAAEALYRRARTRLGGVNGDVMGAMGEVTTAVTLLAAAVALT